MPRLKKQTKKYTKNAKTAKSKKRRQKIPQRNAKKCKIKQELKKMQWNLKEKNAKMHKKQKNL